MKKSLSAICLTFLLVELMGLALADEYAYTTAYFYTPYDVSFRITLLGDPTTTDSGSTAPGPATPSWITFNQTDVCNPNCVDVQPKTNDTYVQNGITQPIITVQNVGNTNQFDFYLNSSVAGEPTITLCANGTVHSGSCVTPPPLVCTDIKEQPSWVPFGTDCNVNTILNITLYATFSGTPPGQITGAVFYRSSH